MSQYFFILWDPFNLEDRFSLLYILGSLVLVAGSGYLSISACVRWLRDREVRRALAIDGLFYPAQKLILWAGMSPVFILLTASMTAWIGGPPIIGPKLGGALWLKTGIEFLAIDFSFFLAHRLQHRIPALWAFHEVHHSAERLNPFTAFRVHPIDDLVTLLLTSVLLGGVDGLWRLGGGAESEVALLIGVNPWLALFYACGFNLRHSEIPITWRWGLSRILMSPCQHQWHHSLDVRDHNINFGFALSLWDQLSGTYRPAAALGPVRVGLEGVRYHSFRALMIAPWKAALGAPRGIFWTLALAGLAALVVMKSWTWRMEEIRSQSVFLEEIRSVDVARGLSQGKTTLIVPTGGMEQNGEHLFLGKHGVVVRQAAEKLARALGSAYVAPVIPYVPNGQIDPPEGHMRYPGSFSIEEGRYEAYLENIVMSARIQGFQRIILLHAHGASQAIENHLAQVLSERWRREGIRVFSAESYYDDRAIRQALLAQGFSEAQLGHHAGLIDTAEVWAVEPAGIWVSALGSQEPGHDGDPRAADRALGDWILDMRLQAVLQSLTAPLKSPE